MVRLCELHDGAVQLDFGTFALCRFLGFFTVRPDELLGNRSGTYAHGRRQLAMHQAKGTPRTALAVGPSGKQDSVAPPGHALSELLVRVDRTRDEFVCGREGNGPFAKVVQGAAELLLLPELVLGEQRGEVVDELVRDEVEGERFGSFGGNAVVEVTGGRSLGQQVEATTSRGRRQAYPKKKTGEKSESAL